MQTASPERAVAHSKGDSSLTGPHRKKEQVDAHLHGIPDGTRPRRLLNHPLISGWARRPLSVLACETALAKAAIRGVSLCSGMVGISS
jgi:hypothetical protein